MALEHGSGSNKSLETHADGSGSSKHSEVSLRAFDGSGSFSSFEKQLDSVDETEFTEDSGSIRHQETRLDVVDESGSSNKSENVNESDRNQSSTMQVSSSSSSSSSSDSLVDHPHVGTNEFTQSAEHDSGAEPTTKDDEISCSSDSSYRSEEDDTNSPADSELTFQVSDVTHESLVHGMTSPPVQTMEHPEGYDPFRIPSSVFEGSKSSTPMEWSVASNESLFSLHVGNSSFSKEQFLTFGDLTKSGELTKSSEIVMFSPSPSSSVLAAETEGKSLEPGKESAGDKELTEKPIKDEARPNAEHSSAKRVPPRAISSNSSRHSHLSEGSETSAHSFAFPILPGGLKSESMRPENEKLQPESPAAKTTTKSSTAYSWFPCLSWCSWSWNCSWRRHCCQCHCSCC